MMLVVCRNLIERLNLSGEEIVLCFGIGLGGLRSWGGGEFGVGIMMIVFVVLCLYNWGSDFLSLELVFS